MRVVRFLFAVMGMAAVVAGCTQQPVAYMVYPPGAASYPAAGIDHVVYGTGGPYVPPRPAVAYAPPAAPSPPPSPPQGPAYVAAPVGAPLAGPAPAYAMASAPTMPRRQLRRKWSPSLRRLRPPSQSGLLQQPPLQLP